MAGGELAIMEALRTPLLSTRATTDRRRIRVFTDLLPVVAAALRHQPMRSAMAPAALVAAAAVAVRPLAVMHAVQAVPPARVPLVHVRGLHLQAR